MPVLSFGDLASAFQLSRFTAQRRAGLDRLSQELATGIKADLGAAVAGDFGPFAGIERNLRRLEALDTSNTETAGFFSAAQIALESTQEITQDAASALLTAAGARDATLIGTAAQDARQKFSSVVSRLNTQFAGRAIFAGTATDSAALAPAEDMLAQIAAATAGLTDTASVVAAVETWFDDPGGGFETFAYRGALNNLGAMTTAAGESVTMPLRADDRALRDLLKGYALAALVDLGILSASIEDRADLIEQAATGLLAAGDDLSRLRATIGAGEARIEDARARNAAETAAYELLRGDIVNADPYETATRLQETYSQIETLYTITARLAALRFSDYMR